MKKTTDIADRAESPQKRCAIYCRKSTDHGMEQAYTSIDAQVDSCSAYINAHAAEGWVQVGVYSDIAVSGATMERPEMKHLLADVAQGKIDCIVAYKLDRISRSVRDFSNLMYELEAKGVSLVITTQNFDTSTPMGRMCVTFLSSFAQFERELIVSRIKDKALAQARQGLWNAGKPPYGYQLGENRTLLVDEPAASVVRGIFDMAANGVECSNIKNILINRGTKAPRGRDPKTWSTALIRRILANRLYAGKMLAAGKEYEGQHEPIVSDSMWNEANRVMKPTRKYQKHAAPVAFPLSDLLYCPNCGERLANYYSYSHGRLCRYYVCPVHRKEPAKCSFTSFSAPTVERTVARHLSTLANDKEVVEAIRARLPQLSSLDIRAALRDVEELVGNLSDAALDTIFHALYVKICYDPQTSTLNFTRHSA